MARTAAKRPAARRRPVRLPAPKPVRARAVPKRTRVRAARTHVRLMVLLTIMVVGFGAIVLRLVDLQALDARHYTQLGLDQRVQTVELPAERGSIFDRNGDDLAVSVPVHSLVADPRVIADPAGDARKLAGVLHLDRIAQGKLRTALAQHDRAFAYVARQVGDGTVAKVKALGLAGISTIPEPKRFYPSNQLAAPVIGWVGTDGNGLFGLESGYDHSLAGKAGFVALERDPQGRDIPDGRRRGRAALRGNDLVLTLDQSLQYETEQALLAEVQTAKARSGAAVIVDVKTGDVLAMANVDGPTDQAPAHTATAKENNRVVSDVYEPGSTNKVVTMSAALDAGLVTPDTTFTIPPSIKVGDRTFTDAEDHGTETMTVADILRQSSNIGTIEIGQKVERARLDAAMRKFGYGNKTAMNLPGEEAGILPTKQEWDSSSSVLGAVPIGQSVAVTAMQMLDVYTTIANDGVSRPPRLVDATIDADGVRHAVRSPRGTRVVSSQTAAQLRTMLAGVVANGTGTAAAIPGYTVAGKTGTAKKAPYNAGQYVASFVGFAPAESPRLAAIVVVDAPSGGEYFGGALAAPVFSRIMQYALRVQEVPPSAAVNAIAAPTVAGTGG